jgi:surfeit locus 1 family protein
LPLDGRRFRPALWPTLAAIAVIGATITLGNWQSRRAEVRGTLQHQAETMAGEPPVAIRRAADVAPDHRYRRATAIGEYLPSRQIWLDNRIYKGVVGFRVLTPLKLDDGSQLLVDRGWLAATPSSARREPPAADPPPGRIEVAGRLNQPPSKFLELAHVEQTGPIVQNLDLEHFAKTGGVTVAPLILEEAPGASHGLVREWLPPDLGRDKNVSYMWQWYGFAALTALLWLIFSWRRS